MRRPDDHAFPLDRARLEFDPTGTTTVKTLRNLLRANGIEPFVVGRRHYVTLSGIKELHQRCLEKQRGPGFSSREGPDGRQSGSFETPAPISTRDALKTIALGPKLRSPGTS